MNFETVQTVAVMACCYQEEIVMHRDAGTAKGQGGQIVLKGHFDREKLTI